MNNILKIVLLVAFYPVLPILYFMLRNESKPKKNIILGVTLPYDARQDESVSQICMSFRKHLGITALFLAVLPVGVFFVKYSSIATTYLMTWLLVTIVLPYVIFTVFHRKLKRLKYQNNWTSNAAGKIILDTKVSVQPQKKLSTWLFMPPFVASLIPVIHAIYNKSGWMFAFVFIIDAMLVAAYYLFYRILYRQRGEIIDGDTVLSMALTRVRSYNWCKVWIG